MVDGLITSGLSFVKCPLRMRPHVSSNIAPFVNECRPRFIFRSRLHLRRVTPRFPLEIVIFQISSFTRFFKKCKHIRNFLLDSMGLDCYLSMVIWPRQIKRDLNFHRGGRLITTDVPINRAFDASQLGIFRLQRASDSFDRSIKLRYEEKERENVNNS